ncbi:MAG: ABC transporter ATP-binding protein [Bryobacter sp.]
MMAIRAEGLKKKYGKVEALRGLSFGVPKGSLCGFIGLNGAGKTTTLKILLDMMRADAGTAEVLGLRLGGAAEGLAIRQKTAFLPEGKRLFPYMTVKDVIDFVRPFYPAWRRDREQQLLATFGLPLERNVNKLSKGMLAKLHMLLALVRGCDLVVMDEPTDGLDAIAVEEALTEMTKQVAEDGTTIVFCSHRLEEIEQVVDHLIILDEGACLLDAPIDEVRAEARRITAVLPDEIEQAPDWNRYGRARREGRVLSLTSWKDTAAALTELRAAGATSIEADPLPLRHLFVDMVRKPKEVKNVVA